ncbi:hypothetical protein THIOKS12180006 [Thiocapsa sp. KS1]|nr:hypothetical protein THIOKS12180006 [Thiocapsa sp. KS1]
MAKKFPNEQNRNNDACSHRVYSGHPQTYPQEL